MNLKHKINKYLALLILLFFIVVVGCEKELKEYSVTLIYDEYTQIKQVKENSLIDFEPLDQDNYLFIGWYNEDYSELLNGKEVKSDLTLYAKVVKKGIGYNISYDLDGGELIDKQVRRYVVGETTTLPNAKKEPNFEFIGWSINSSSTTTNEISDTTYGDLQLKAIYIDHNNYHKITYVTNGGVLSNNPLETYREGDNNFVTTYASKQGYYFKGWYKEDTFSNLIRGIDSSYKEDITLYAKFEEALPENTKISFLGDSITTFAGSIPDGFASYYPTPGCDVTTAEATWWYKAAARLNYSILMNNSYSGSLITNTGTNANYAEDIERIKYLEKDNETPDIIIIHMGTNDFTHGVTGERFKNAYKKMIENIKYLYDDVIIYVCLLPSNTYGENHVPLRLANNEIIKEVASIYNLNILDLTTVLTDENCRGYIYAGSHPNASGMDAIATFVYNELKK